jgi:ribosomal protein L11 methyltransferase
VLVVVATDTCDVASAARELRSRGATTVTETATGGRRVLVYGGPFDDGDALRWAADIRHLGWATDVRPEGGGHLAAWRSHTSPVVVDSRLWVCFPWSECDRDGAEIVLEIDPGRAFGTGAHPTTRLLLQELARRVRGGERVLDVGCGSGVLAIAAAGLGASEVTAIDINEEAITATKANATRNGQQKKVIAEKSQVQDLTATYDIVVANIHAGTLIELAPAIERCVAPTGWLALSGLSPAQASKVEAAYKDLQVVAELQDEDWLALVASRRRGAA